jgi:hypothetical protein
MAHESRWRTESNRVILAALESGRAAGLEGVEISQKQGELGCSTHRNVIE